MSVRESVSDLAATNKQLETRHNQLTKGSVLMRFPSVQPRNKINNYRVHQSSLNKERMNINKSKHAISINKIKDEKICKY